MPAIVSALWAGPNALRGLATGGTLIALVSPANGDEGLHVLNQAVQAGRDWAARAEPPDPVAPERLAPLPFPIDEIEFDIYDPPLLAFRGGPTGSVRVTLVNGGRWEPLPFPVEDLEGTEWEEE